MSYSRKILVLMLVLSTVACRTREESNLKQDNHKQENAEALESFQKSLPGTWYVTDSNGKVSEATISMKNDQVYLESTASKKVLVLGKLDIKTKYDIFAGSRHFCLLDGDNYFFNDVKDAKIVGTKTKQVSQDLYRFFSIAEKMKAGFRDSETIRNVDGPGVKRFLEFYDNKSQVISNAVNAYSQKFKKTLKVVFASDPSVSVKSSGSVIEIQTGYVEAPAEAEINDEIRENVESWRKVNALGLLGAFERQVKLVDVATQAKVELSSRWVFGRLTDAEFEAVLADIRKATPGQKLEISFENKVVTR